MRLKPSKLSTWNTAGRPSGKRGDVGYNTEIKQVEIYDGSSWVKNPTLGSDNTFTGSNIFDPAPIFLLPHGTFYSLATQSIANIANAQVIAFEYDADVELLTHSTVTNNSRIYVPTKGSYEVIFSGIADLVQLPANKHIEVWAAINGSYVTDSNTIVEIPNISIEQTVAVSWILDMDANQYLELYTWGDDTDVQWLATAAGTNPTRPACPSVIITIKKISSYP